VNEIKVFSRKDRGSIFTFCIPVDSVMTQNNFSHDTKSLKSILTPKNLRTMLVDDEPFNLTIFKGFLKELSIKVIDKAVNGLEAYQRYQKHVYQGNYPHIVTMDLDMPIMNGKEAARIIREFEIKKGSETMCTIDYKWKLYRI